MQEVTAGNKSQGVGGDYVQRISGIASSISKGKNEQKGETVWTGSESVNGWQILEELLGIVAEMAQTLQTHTHQNAGVSQQAQQFASQAQKASQAKSRLSPIVA